MMNRTDRILDLYDRLTDQYEIVHGAKTEAKRYNVSQGVIQYDIRCIKSYLREKALEQFEKLLRDTNGDIDSYVHYIEERRIEYNRTADAYIIKRYSIEASQFEKVANRYRLEKFKMQKKKSRRHKDEFE